MSASRAKTGLAANVWKVGAGTLSAGAALVSILSYTNSVKGLVGSPKKPLLPSAPLETRWVGLAPSADTLTALGDSLQLAVTATDERGATQVGITPVWTSTEDGVASVDQGGRVVARGPGMTTIVVSVGRVSARSRITVRQTPAGVRLSDTLIRIPEGEHVRPPARVVDARGGRIAGTAVSWRTSDAAVVAMDSLGQATGMSPGEATLTAAFGELQAGLRVEVAAVPASVTVVAGEDQRALAGRALSTPVTAQIVSRSGRPVPGVPVEFRIQGGEGTSTPSADTSDGRGIVRTVWTLGNIPGRQHLAIAVDAVSLSPVLTAEADPVASNTRVTLVSEDLTGQVGDTLEQPVRIRVTDSLGAALADLPASWSTPNGGSLVPLGGRTDSLGEARARWKLGPKAGRQRVQVQVGNARTMPIFTARATALAGSSASLVQRSGDAQTGTVGTLLPRPIVVLAVDRLGNPVPDARLSLLPRSGSASDSAIRTDSIGQAKVRWTLGRSTGPQRMTLRAEGVPVTLELTARARSGRPTKLEFLPPRPAAALSRSAAKSVTVQLADDYGNPIAEQTVRFHSTSGTVSPARAVTDAQGEARVRWTPARKATKASLVAEVPGTEARATLTLP
jgi:Big-like domain-containing protein